MKKTFVTVAVLVLVAIATACKKDSPNTPQGYFPQVKAIIHDHCLSCHSAVSGTHNGLPVTFDTDSSITQGYANIKAVVADPVTPGPLGNKRMPENDSLTPAQIDIIVQWYNKGGKATD